MNNRSKGTNNNDRPRVEWGVARDVSCGAATARLKKLPIGRPKFSVQIGTGIGDDFRPYVSINDSSTGVEVSWQALHDAIEALRAEALAEITQADETWQARQAKQQSKAPNVRDPGKTEREAAKRKRWEQNRAAKADENRRRASAAGSGHGKK